VTATIKGLSEFKRELRAIDAALPKEMAAANKDIAKQVSDAARSNARSAGGVWARAASAITPRATADMASVGVSATSRAPMALPAFWGARARTGWFAQAKYADYTSQHPEWVGNTWEAASRNQGPYVINYTLLEESDRIVERFADAVDQVSRKAFPD
jgi:hypothetical protein